MCRNFHWLPRLCRSSQKTVRFAKTNENVWKRGDVNMTAFTPQIYGFDHIMAVINADNRWAFKLVLESTNRYGDISSLDYHPLITTPWIIYCSRNSTQKEWRFSLPAMIYVHAFICVLNGILLRHLFFCGKIKKKKNDFNF